jgi:hypothetical protein
MSLGLHATSHLIQQAPPLFHVNDLTSNYSLCFLYFMLVSYFNDIESETIFGLCLVQLLSISFPRKPVL